MTYVYSRHISSQNPFHESFQDKPPKLNHPLMTTVCIDWNMAEIIGNWQLVLIFTNDKNWRSKLEPIGGRIVIIGGDINPLFVHWWLPEINSHWLVCVCNSWRYGYMYTYLNLPQK